MKISSKTLVAAALTFVGTLQQARADVVVIVSAASTANITAAQISRIYLGDSNIMTPFDIANAPLTRHDFYTKLIGKDYAEVKSRWAQLVFTGKGAAPKELAGGEDVVKAVAADPHAIGYVDRSFVNMTVKVIYTVK